MAILLSEVQAFTEPALPLFGTLVQKLHGGTMYTYWSVDDVNAPSYISNLAASRVFWATYASFDGAFFVDTINTGQNNSVICGYAVKCDSIAASTYSSAIQRLTSPFKFYTSSETTNTWKYFNGLWLPFYQWLVLGLRNTQQYVPLLDLPNIYIYQDNFYYGWLFDITTTESSMIPTHPKYKELLALYKSSAQDYNDLVAALAVDVYSGNSPNPYA